MDEVAREAMVSRATAYRYFPSIEALLVEAPLDGAVPGPGEVFAAGDQSTDVAERAVRAERAMHEAVYRNEAQLRVMLAASLERGGNGSEVPVRQNRRTPLIEAALAPARERLGEEAYGRLCAALALVFGTEAMVVFKDVLGVDEERAREVKGWAVRALVRAAENERS
jgi:AcrR family transcriptional regulator